METNYFCLCLGIWAHRSRSYNSSSDILIEDLKFLSEMSVYFTAIFMYTFVKDFMPDLFNELLESM